MIEINKIYNIDCFDGFKLLEDKSIDYVFFSPPFNRKANDKYTYYNDNIKDYYKFLSTLIDESLRVSKKHVIMNIQKTMYNKKDVFKIIGNYSDKIQEIFIWEKTNPMPAAGNAITNAYEFFIIFGDSSIKSNSTYTKNVITSSVNTKTSKIHKALMHPDISDYFIRMFTQENDIILDPMNGLATTSISCKKYNRKYIGFEISKEYYEESLKRIEEWKDDNVKPNSLSEKEIEEVMLEADTILHRLNND